MSLVFVPIRSPSLSFPLSFPMSPPPFCPPSPLSPPSLSLSPEVGSEGHAVASPATRCCAAHARDLRLGSWFLPIRKRSTWGLAASPESGLTGFWALGFQRKQVLLEWQAKPCFSGLVRALRTPGTRFPDQQDVFLPEPRLFSQQSPLVTASH